MLIDIAKSSDISNLQITEETGILHISGIAPSADVKNKLWDVYNQIDANFLSKDVLMDIEVTAEILGTRACVITESTNLNVRKGPGIDQPIIGKASKDEVITLISRANNQWWLIRTSDGQEGYCYAMYLKIMK